MQDDKEFTGLEASMIKASELVSHLGGLPQIDKWEIDGDFVHGLNEDGFVVFMLPKEDFDRLMNMKPESEN